MKFEAEQLAKYESDGYVEVPSLLVPAELGVLKDELAALVVRTDEPGFVMERDQQTVRALHGCHLRSRIFRDLTRLPRLVSPVMSILSDDVYVYQFKIHLKPAFKGEGWKWHQDYPYWHHEDGMPAPATVTVLLFLDDVSEFNGPMMMIRGSHRRGLAATVVDEGSGSRVGAPWLSHVSHDLKYTLSEETVVAMTREGPIVAPKGPAGNAVFFHANVAHAAGPNMSPQGRASVFITYNSVRNAPRGGRDRRPEFLVSRDASPIEVLPVDALV